MSPSRPPIPEPVLLVPGRAGDPGRPALVGVVRAVYAAAYGARLTHFHELLLGLAATDGSVLGAIGATPARAHERCFLEVYLDEPVEQRLSRALGRPVLRERLVEVGNLAAIRPGIGAALLGTLAFHLRAGGHDIAVFTATAGLRSIFDRLGLHVHDLARADGARLGSGLADWGRYYETDPRVVAVDIAATCAAVGAQDGLARSMGAVWAAAEDLAGPVLRARRGA